MLLSSAERAPYVLEEELTEEKLLGGEDFGGVCFVMATRMVEGRGAREEKTA